MDRVVLKEPIACTDEERLAFARLVRKGFPGARNLNERIREAKCLAFHYAAPDSLAAIAALKAPSHAYRSDVFARAGAPVSAAEYELELGWVFVVPAHRAKGVAGHLCRELMERASASCIFATTRPHNVPMIDILRALGFARVGRPYLRGNEELVLFLRSGPASGVPPKS